MNKVKIAKLGKEVHSLLVVVSNRRCEEDSFKLDYKGKPYIVKVVNPEHSNHKKKKATENKAKKVAEVKKKVVKKK